MTAPSDPRAILLEVLATNGIRVTRPRRAVLDVLVELDRPVSAAEIHDRLRERDVNLRLEQRIRRTTRFRVLDHDLRLYGVCARCGSS